MKPGRFFLIAAVVLLLVDLISACHCFGGFDYIGCRYRRGALAGTIKSRFPVCLRGQLSQTPGYQKRDWRGAVSFTIFHSDWYAQSKEICKGALETMQCWVNVLPSFISGSSPAYQAVQRCIKEHYEYHYGLALPEPIYPTGSTSADSSNCTVVDESAYTTDFFSSANKPQPDPIHQFSKVVNDDDESLTDFGDLLDFAKKDLICSDPKRCSCSNLEISVDDSDGYEFDDGKSCGSCWATRLAASVRSGSQLRGPASNVAKKRCGLKRKPKGHRRNKP